ncbi:hypothetical protein KUCAC02_027715 [Chaenocephalus aceratus]|uniref:Uncharacterized protein n=1 Tax=Chaenocephalus aceratus TaxID=36190 RepID=A0ACB9W602_CHAAC|nr:hypothetical protein KUCAC02_027715 [Chaenocephalus aceratus]
MRRGREEAIIKFDLSQKKLVQANKWAAHPSQDPSSTWLLTWLRFIQSTENHDGPALQVDSGPPARPQPATPHPAQDPSPPLPEWLLTWLPRPSPPVPEEGWSLVPCAHPTRIVLRWPQRSGSSSSSRSSSCFSSCSCFSCSSSPVLSCRPSPPVPEEGWSLVPCAHPTRIVLRRPQRSGSSPRPEPPREPLPVRKVPEQQWMKSVRLLMKKRSQVGSRWRKRGAEAAGMSAGNGAAKRFCPST